MSTVYKMNQDWEKIFTTWAQPPSKSEQDRCENAEKAIRNAIASSAELNRRNIKVFTQGSYRNRTNVRQESDVDIGVLCYDVFFPVYPEGTTKETFGNVAATYEYATFKSEVGEALISYFGAGSVHRGNKAFDLKENSYHVEADVAAFFEHRRYEIGGSYLSGVELRPDNGMPFKVINWPEQHYTNGVQKNTDTLRSYNGVVRILKSLCYLMQDQGVPAAKPIIGFLVECLVWNVPNPHFGNNTWSADLRNTLAFLFNNTISDEKCSEWGEVSELKYLFRPSQKWTRQQAHDFISAAWDFVGFP